MGLTELLILISILVIVAIVLRVIVGAMNSRKNKIKIALEKNIPEYDLDELELRELPSGGARMVQRSFEEVMRQASELDNRDAAKHRVPRSKVLKTDLSREAVLARRAALLAAGGSLATAEQVREPDLFSELPPADDVVSSEGIAGVDDASVGAADVDVAENVAEVADVADVVEIAVAEVSAVAIAEPDVVDTSAEPAPAAAANDHTNNQADEDVLAAVLFADAEAAVRAAPATPAAFAMSAAAAATAASAASAILAPTPVWAAAAVRADEYDARTQSSAQGYVDDNDWLDDVSPVREVRVDRSTRAEPTFSEMRFDENLGLVELDSQPLIPAAPVAAEQLYAADDLEAPEETMVEPESQEIEPEFADLEPEVEDDAERVHPFEPEPEADQAPVFMLEPTTNGDESSEADFVFGSAIAPQSEFDLDMANDAEPELDNVDDQDDADDQDYDEDYDDEDNEDDLSDDEEDEFADDDFNDDEEEEDFDESNVTQNWFIDDMDQEDEPEPEPQAERVVPELDDMLDELLHERGVSTDVDYSIVIPQPEPEPEIEVQPEPEIEQEPEPQIEQVIEPEIEPEIEQVIEPEPEPAAAVDAEPDQKKLDDDEEEPLPDFESELEVEPEPQPQPVDSFAAVDKKDQIDDLFEDEDQQRRQGALEQEQESAPKRFMSWAGAAFGKLTAGVAASRARSEQKSAEQANASQEKVSRKSADQRDNDLHDMDDYADPLDDYAVDRSRGDDPRSASPGAQRDEYQDEFQEEFHEEFHEEFQQDSPEHYQRRHRDGHADEAGDTGYADEYYEEYQSEPEPAEQHYQAPMTEQERKIAKYGESPYAGHRFGVDSVPADPIATASAAAASAAAASAAAAASRSPYAGSRTGAASPTQGAGGRAATAPRATSNVTARSARENQLSLDMPQDDDDKDPGYSQVLVINVMARPKTSIQGDELLPILLGAGLRFGEMSIFHRHADRKGGPVLFSVANALNPGTFDLNRISDFSTQGVCFFMTLPNVANNMLAFEQMLATAKHVQSVLDAELKDDNRSVMTAQTVEHYRQRIRDFDLQQLKNSKNPRQK